MAKCSQQGLLIVCLVLVVCSSITEQIRGQNANKIEGNMQAEVKDAVESAGDKLNVCFAAPGGFYCCSKDNECYPSIEACLPKCKYNEN
uniref:Uncharacterized protein n=1 Tax=Oryza brachyantha TaxID=4533 RepID=J3N852_ORYBR